MNEYEPFDQAQWLGEPPWDNTPALDEWEIAHGHDVRLKCYVEFGCMVIEPALERRIAALEADLAAAKFAEREWHDKAQDLIREREDR